MFSIGLLLSVSPLHTTVRLLHRSLCCPLFCPQVLCQPVCVTKPEESGRGRRWRVKYGRGAGAEGREGCMCCRSWRRRRCLITNKSSSGLNMSLPPSSNCLATGTDTDVDTDTDTNTANRYRHRHRHRHRHRYRYRYRHARTQTLTSSGTPSQERRPPSSNNLATRRTRIRRTHTQPLNTRTTHRHMPTRPHHDPPYYCRLALQAYHTLFFQWNHCRRRV